MCFGLFMNVCLGFVFGGRLLSFFVGRFWFGWLRLCFVGIVGFGFGFMFVVCAWCCVVTLFVYYCLK